jgi:hypothetical protein
MPVITVDGEVYHAIEAAAPGGESLNHSLRRLLGLPPTTEAGGGPRLVGELAGLIRAGMLAPGDRLLATAPVPDPDADPVATVTDDARLRAADGTIHPGPRQLLLELRGGTFAPYGWHCLTTTDATRLETLRQRLHTADHPDQAATGHGALTALIAAGLLAPGDQLSLPMYRHTGGPGGRGSQPIAVGTATVTDDGCFLLPDGSRHLTPSSASAAHRGNPTNAWGSWTAPDGSRLTALRQLQQDRAASC